MNDSNETGTPNPLPPEQDPDTMPEQDGGKRPSRRKAAVAAVAAVAVVAVCVGGFAAWRVHENRLDERARADCAHAATSLKTSRTAWERLLRDTKDDVGKIQSGQVKDAKTIDALNKAMDAKTPTGSASCTAGDRKDAENATASIRKAENTYDADSKMLSKAVKAVETSKLDKTVDDANALYKDSDGKVADDKTRASLLDAIKKRDADAIAKAVKEVNESKTAREKADAEAAAKAKAEQEAAAQAAAAAAAQSQRQAQSYTPSYTNAGTSSGRSYTNAGSAGASSDSTGGSSSGGSGWSGPTSGGHGDPGACSLEDCSIPIQH